MKTLWKSWTDKPLALPITLMVVVLLGAAAGFTHWEARTQNEHVGFFEGLWWAVVTLTTVGYGDFVPRTVPGRIMGMAVMFSGLGLVSAITGSLASVLVERRVQKRRGMLDIMSQGHVLIMGWNGHGPVLARQLSQLRDLGEAPLVLVDPMEPSRFEEISEALGLRERLKFVRGQANQKAVLERAHPDKARMGFILAGPGEGPEESDNQGVLTALTFREVAPRVPLYAEAAREQSREHLWRAGVTQVLGQEELAGLALGLMAVHPVMHDFLQALLARSQPSPIRFRPLTPTEKTLGWKDLVKTSLEKFDQLPVAVCRLPRDLALSDILDSSQALDQYILDLFKQAGRGTSLGSQGPKVLINPPTGQDLSEFDGLLYFSSRP
jgi:voltage-gated potassium channel